MLRRMCVTASVFVAVLVAAPAVGHAVGNGLAGTPPMGWNSWNRFHCGINETVIKQAADGLVSSGLRDAGYEYVNIDDCWAAPHRDPQTGRLVPNPSTFPRGIKEIADYVHARGLKLGIYSSAGTQTCAKTMPGSLDHEKLDAQTFADWGVDYLKYDNCNNEGRPARGRYAAMADAIAATGRPMVLAICEWGANKPWTWAANYGQLWRTTDDISDSWDRMLWILDQQAGLERYSHPDAWNDPDMLEVGNGGMSDTEYRAHFALWSILNAPLIAGNDLSHMSAATREILGNRDLIAVDQDWGGEQGHRIRDDGDTEVWVKPDSDGSVAVLLLNRAATPAPIAVSATDAGLPPRPRYELKDLWTKRITHSSGMIRAAVPAHGAAVYRVTGQSSSGTTIQQIR